MIHFDHSDVDTSATSESAYVDCRLEFDAGADADAELDAESDADAEMGGDTTFVPDDVHSPTTNIPEYCSLDAYALFASHVSMLPADGIVLRECLPALSNAQAMLQAAQKSADELLFKAGQQAVDMRSQAEEESHAWLDNQRDELYADMYFQQTQWLAQLQPIWVQALETTLRKICGDTLRPDAFAGAIAMGLREFKNSSALELYVHPDDLTTAASALAQLPQAAQLITATADAELTLGVCRLRSPDLEVTLQLDRALDRAMSQALGHAAGHASW